MENRTSTVTEMCLFLLRAVALLGSPGPRRFTPFASPSFLSSACSCAWDFHTANFDLW